MGKKLMALFMGACVTLLFAATGIFAGTEFKDHVTMETKELGAHKKTLVEFSHKKHVDAYKATCGDCHHDAAGKAITPKAGDDVKRCVECHTGIEKVKGEKLSKEDAVKKYYYDAIHANCVGCHKESNIKNGDPKGKGPAPTSCTDCHPKK
ncbi:MAG: cytochrome c3 family protein [Pseudomonadota bacterium]